MKEVECSVASNVEKSVEVGAKHTEIRTSLMRPPYTAVPRGYPCSSLGITTLGMILQCLY